MPEALNNYSSKWCRIKHAELDALSYWKKSIMDIIDTRISFYTSNNHLLPRKHRFNFCHLKKGIQDFHSKYVFVPADKATYITNNMLVP